MAQRRQHGSPSSAAQPALASDGAAQPSSLPGGAAQPTLLSDGAEQPTLCQLPESTKELAVGFYNVVLCLDEIGKEGWKQKQRRLKTDIAKAFNVHALDVLCLSALGQLNESLDDRFEEGTATWIKSLISAEEGMMDITTHADDHYVTIVKDRRVEVTEYEIVRGFVPGQKERSFQLFRVLATGTNQQVCIINCDALASKTRELSWFGRMLYLKTFNHMSGADPFIWGGNLNSTLIELATLLRIVDPRYLITGRDTSSAEQPGTTEVVYSHPLRFQPGDFALTRGLRAAQVNSEVGRFHSGASADHDLVVAKVFVPASVAGTTDARHSATSPSQESSDSETEISSESVTRAPQKRKSSSRAAQPALPRESGSSGRAAQPAPTRFLASKAKQKARTTTVSIDSDSSDPARSPPRKKRSSSRAAQPVVLKARPLPRIIKIFASNENRDLQNVLENISRQYMWDKLSRVLATTTGCWDMAVPLPAVEKLEAFLEIIETQRAAHLRRNPGIAANAIFSSLDMKEIHKTWMEDGEWMSVDKAREYRRLSQSNGRGDRQKAHKMRKSAFSAFLFQVIGNKHVLLAAIQHPVFSAAQPEAVFGSDEQPAAMLQRFMDAWEQEKTTEDYKKRVEMSARRTEERTRLKNAAHEARRDLVQGRKINDAILRGALKWDDLDVLEKALLDDFNSGKLRRVQEERDADFGWNRAASSAAGSAASRLTSG